MKIAVLMDDIRYIKTYKDTTFALMLAAQELNYEIWIFQQQDWFIRDGEVFARAEKIKLQDKSSDYYQVLNQEIVNLSAFDYVLQRKDPPFNLNFIYDSYMLDLLVLAGVKVINPPQALRNVNEKFIITRVPQCCPESLLTKSKQDILNFVKEFKTAVLKPLDGMGGRGIFRLKHDDPNLPSILENMNHDGQQTLLVQRYLDKVTEGDKRVFIINGKAANHCLVRIPQGLDFRANLAAGGKGVVEALSKRDYELVEQLQALIKAENLYLVGLDVIGGYITEINVTSPTGMREIAQATGENLALRFWQELT